MVLDPHASPGGGRGTLDYGSYIDVSNTVSYATSSVATPHLPSPSELAHNTTSAAQLLLVFRKLSWYLLPVFFLLNMLNYLDRTNLAFASIQMSQDLDLTTVQYGIGSGLFFVGYSTFQLPSQMILRTVGAPVWLAIIVTIWGITAACMAAVTDEISFYIVRLVLGFAEAGSFPAYWYYLTRFYPDKHITIPYSITDSAIMIAQVIGAPMAAGLLQLDGFAGLRGWQWLFIAEGAPTLLLGVCMPFLLPSDPKSARCLSSSEAEALDEEMTACRSGNSMEEHTSMELLKSALQNSFMYIMGLVKFGKDFTAYGCMFWAPMLIRGLLHNHQHSGDSCSAWEGSETGAPDVGYKEVLLTGIPYSFAALSSILVAWNSQRTGDRKWHICIFYTLGGIMLLALPAASEHSITMGFVVLTLVIVFSLCPNGALLALASAGGEGPALPLNLAVFNSIGNISGMFGPLLLGVVVGRTCSYNLAFYIMGIILCMGGLLVHLVEDKPKTGHRPPSKSASYVELSQQQNVPHINRNSVDASLHASNMDPASVLEEA